MQRCKWAQVTAQKINAVNISQEYSKFFVNVRPEKSYCKTIAFTKVNFLISPFSAI